ncbi:MAG: sodium ion-translocating decarboxylase subunit beta [Dehalococcoidia bacterium]|nr:sodium ion-translocating decarboxylase subunit beta [Dehalococcoidia bacterium]
MPDLNDYFRETGIYHLEWGSLLLLAVGIGFVLVAVAKKKEPYVLLPIGLGIVLGNLPENALTELAAGDPLDAGAIQESGILGLTFHFALSFWNVLPPLIFLGLGAMTDFGPILANPKSLLLGAAAQIGIFVAFWGALGLDLAPGFDFSNKDAAAISIIGGADGPTTIFASAVLAPDLLGRTAVVAYSYMAGVVFIQPPIMRLLTTRAEREIVMRPSREVSRLEKLVFPVMLMVIVILLVPEAAPLIGMFAIGNLFAESGVVPRLSQSASNEVLNVVTIFLMIAVGAQLSADRVLELETLAILGLGLAAFACGTTGGLIAAKVMNMVVKDKVNPLIGSAGVSAVPMAARISHMVGQEANPNNFLLPHAMGPNVAGVIGSAVVAGVFISLLS